MKSQRWRFLSLISLQILLAMPFIGKAQITDSSLIKKLSVNGVCLCNVTISGLKQQGNDLKEVNVEEMDLAKDCMGEDSRFIAGRGYMSNKYPGMIFQKDQNTDQISKISLTKKFSGRLPDGKFIDMNGLLLKDLFKMYPKLKDTWGSRDCSSYWNFSNDTLSFYVKIDKNKKPQFPIAEAYYANKSVEGADLMVSCYSFRSDIPKVAIIEPNDPVFFLDSVKVNRGVLENYNPSEIASITVYKDSNAVKRIGPEGKNGLIYIETKISARQRYWRYFKSKSNEYAKVVPTDRNDSFVQYILNNKVLKDSYEADLSSINDQTFKSLTIINKAQLLKDYGISDKAYGVVIITDNKQRNK